jgi:hypothetical protein
MPEPDKLFMQFYYPETKDLCKTFLTLVTAVLVFSLTFSDRIVDFARATKLARRLLLSSWFSMLGAILVCGVGLAYVSAAAAQAATGEFGYFQAAMFGWKCIVIAGVSFGVGLCALIAAGTVSISGRRDRRRETAAAEQGDEADEP